MLGNPYFWSPNEWPGLDVLMIPLWCCTWTWFLRPVCKTTGPDRICLKIAIASLWLRPCKSAPLTAKISSPAKRRRDLMMMSEQLSFTSHVAWHQKSTLFDGFVKDFSIRQATFCLFPEHEFYFASRKFYSSFLSMDFFASFSGHGNLIRCPKWGKHGFFKSRNFEARFYFSKWQII